MPLPKKKNGEKRGKFIQRCMADPTARKDFKDPKQRVAVCYSLFDRKEKK